MESAKLTRRHRRQVTLVTNVHVVMTDVPVSVLLCDRDSLSNPDFQIFALGIASSRPSILRAFPPIKSSRTSFRRPPEVRR